MPVPKKSIPKAIEVGELVDWPLPPGDPPYLLRNLFKEEQYVRVLQEYLKLQQVKHEATAQYMAALQEELARAR